MTFGIPHATEMLQHAFVHGSCRCRIASEPELLKEYGLLVPGDALHIRSFLGARNEADIFVESTLVFRKKLKSLHVGLVGQGKLPVTHVGCGERQTELALFARRVEQRIIKALSRMPVMLLVQKRVPEPDHGLPVLGIRTQLGFIADDRLVEFTRIFLKAPKFVGSGRMIGGYFQHALVCSLRGKPVDET
ncbi:MAG: hypothetical protein BWY06_02914 [Candidatus Latescibacteria bacterium ADurb.Bin168]|nr:MAG: hypothetical protein BWY06_02914 [Candidatus Latescibacteria bacterium ADurb.Bin168]